MKLQEGGSPPNDAVAGEPSEEASERQMPTPPRYDPTTRDSRQPSPVEQHNTPPPIPLSTQEPVRRRTRSQTPQIADPPPPAPPPAGSTHDDPQPDGRVLRRSKRSRSNASPSTVPLSSLAQPTPPVRAQSENPSTKASTAVIAVDPNFLRTGPTRATRASSRARSVERQTQGAPRNTGGRDSKGALAAVQEAQEDEDASSEKLLLPPAITEQSVRPTQRFKSGVLELDRRSRECIYASKCRPSTTNYAVINHQEPPRRLLPRHFNLRARHSPTRRRLTRLNRRRRKLKTLFLHRRARRVRQTLARPRAKVRVRVRTRTRTTRARCSC